MDPSREKRSKTDTQKSKDPLSLDQEFLRIRQPVAASERKEIKSFLEKVTTDVKSEIRFLQDMIDYQSNNYYYPFENPEALENFIRDWIGLSISHGQMSTQINELKKKCEKRAKKFYEDCCFLSFDEGEALLLGEKIWGSEIKAIPKEEKRKIAPSNPTANEPPPATIVSSNVTEGVGGVEERSPICSPSSWPVQRGIGATASSGGLQEEAPRNYTAIHPLTPLVTGNVREEDDAPVDDSFLCCNENFDELIIQTAVSPSEQSWENEEDEEEEDLSPFHPRASSLSSNVPEGVDTIRKPATSGISVTATYDGVEEVDVAKLKDSPAEIEDFINVLCDESEVILPPSSSLSGNVLQNIGPEWSTIVSTEHGGLQEEDLNVASTNPTAIHLPTPVLASNVQKGAGTIVGPVSSGIDVTALYAAMEEEHDLQLDDLTGDSLLRYCKIHHSFDAVINQSEVLPSDQPGQKEGEKDLTTIHPPTSYLSGNVPEGVQPVWREIGVTASQGELQEEQLSAPGNCTAIQLPTPLLSSNVPEGVDTILGSVSSGRGSIDGIQDEIDAELKALIAYLFPNNKKDALLEQGEVLPSDRPGQNEGGEEPQSTCKDGKEC